MDLYIILTYDIHSIGGTQAYTWGKMRYLIRNGWDTAVFFPGQNTGNSPYPFLDKYIHGGFLCLSTLPIKANKNTIDCIIRKMLKEYNIEKNNYNKIIVESHYNDLALWGELISRYLGAKHMCFICNEYFDKGRQYGQHLDFYKFKYDRKELYGIDKSSISKLFDNRYENIPKEEKYYFNAYYPQEIVQDIYDARLDKLTKADWNIVYFSRAGKGYFETVLDEVAKFAKNHEDKKIQFIIVSDVLEKKLYIERKYSNNRNIILQIMGTMSPVPKKLFEVADVVIAGSGCATWSYRNNAYTLVVDAKNTMKANGFLGYDTFNSLFAETESIQKDISQYLELLLVNKKYENIIRQELKTLTQKREGSPYDEHFELVDRSSSKKEYYNILHPSRCIPIMLKDQVKLLIQSDNHLYSQLKKRNFG